MTMYSFDPRSLTLNNGTQKATQNLVFMPGQQVKLVVPGVTVLL